MTFDELPPVVKGHYDSSAYPAFNVDNKSNAEFWENWMKKVLSDKEVINEDDQAWKEPEVLIRLDDPAEGPSQGKIFICHHCSFEWDDLSVLRAHIESQHLSKLQSDAAALPVNLAEISLGPEISLIPLSPHQHETLPPGMLSLDRDSKNEASIEKRKNCLECPNCDFKCAKLRTLKKHLRLKHRNTKPFECRFCKFSTFYPKVLKRHTRSKHPEVQPYSCNQCLFASHDEIILKTHVINEHTNDLLHSCPHCHYVSGQCSALTAHVKIKHPNEEMFQCLQCAVRPVESVSSSEGSKGITLKSKNEEVKTGRVHHCGECEYQTTQLAHLKRHIISNHTFERPYRCVHCHYTTARSDHLRKHIINKHANENTYHCTECSFTSPHASDLKSHIKLMHSSYNTDLAMFPLSTQFETDLRSFTCSTCDFSTSQHDNLKEHVLNSHYETQCYRCDFCVFTTYSKENLKQHKHARHLKQEANQCLNCEYSAFNCDELKSHVFFHGWD